MKASPCSTLCHRKSSQNSSGSDVRFKRGARPHILSSSNQDGHNAVGLLVGAAGKRCIPSTQFSLTVDTGAAYRFPHNAALRVQVRLGNIGFTTVLEKIQDQSAKD